MAHQHPTLPPIKTTFIDTDYAEKVYNPGAIPKIPLRVPKKSSRNTISPQTCFSPGGSSSPSSAASTITNMGRMSCVYIADSMEGFDGDKGLATPEISDEADEKQWFAHRNRSRRFLVVVGLVTFVILATLAIALPLALRNKVSTQGRQTDGHDESFDTPVDEPIDTSFPAGAFVFETSLQEFEAGCTSRNTTWRCDAEQLGDPSVFYWNITQLSLDAYTITSQENSIAPDFRDISLKIRDYNKSTERLEFSFSANKTVTPSDAGSPTNRAANCTYTGVMFNATLYTRKRRGNSIDPPRGHAKYSAWPGDVQIVQSLASTVGQPVCRDASNNVIADVAASSGTCQCRYSNADSRPQASQE